MTSVQVDASRLFRESYGGRVVAGLPVIEEQPGQHHSLRSATGAIDSLHRLLIRVC